MSNATPCATSISALVDHIARSQTYVDGIKQFCAEHNGTPNLTAEQWHELWDKVSKDIEASRIMAGELLH